MCPWVSTVWWTLPCVGNASCFGYSFVNGVKKSLLSIAIVQTPIYVGHHRHNTRQTGLTSHLSPWGRCKWMDEAEAQTKPGVSIYSSEGTQPGSRPCQRSSLWVVNESASWIWVQSIPLTTPHLASLLPAFPQNYETLKTKTPCEGGSLQGDLITLR